MTNKNLIDRQEVIDIINQVFPDYMMIIHKDFNTLLGKRELINKIKGVKNGN